VSRSPQSQERAPYSERMIRMIETSRAEPHSVEFQSGPKGGSGSLSFSIQPMPQQGSEKDVSGIEQSALGAGPSLVTKPLPNSAEGGEIAPHVHSTTQMPVLGESQAHVAGLPHHTPGIYPQFLARHSTDQSLLNNNQTRTRNPQISGTRSQMRPDVNSQNLFLVGHTYPNHRNMPTEQDDTAGWPSTMERRRITERWCYCFRLVENDDDLRPICELCLRHRYRGPRTCSQMNQHVCCYCFQDGVGDFLSLPCHHKFHRDCIIAAIQLNMLNCPICGQAFLHLP
ncbi:E3 ubiquitin-protein ligase RNF6-like, partial [Pocillopora damicornis]